jgi:membrane-bound ClpP family serine protease
MSSVLGHAHELGHDIVHGDVGHGDGHDESGHITSIFSTRVVATFLMGFGAAGGVAKYYNFNYPMSCLIGIGVGIVVGALMFWLLEVFARQQANSLINTSSLVGSLGTVTIPIQGGQPGEVAVSYSERYNTYMARSRFGKNIGKGKQVRVASTVGSDLIVEEVQVQ